jgi:hypothetical protein
VLSETERTREHLHAFITFSWAAQKFIVKDLLVRGHVLFGMSSLPGSQAWDHLVAIWQSMVPSALVSFQAVPSLVYFG